MTDDQNAGAGAGVYATKDEVQALGERITHFDTALQGFQETLAKILGWLQGGFDAEGQYEPGLIEQNRRMMNMVGTGIKYSLWLLSTIAVGVLTTAGVNVANHFKVPGFH